MLVCIEGCDGSGKATQSKLLVERVARNNVHATLFSFPRYDTPIGHTIKRHLMREIVLNEVKHVLDSGGQTGRTLTRRAQEDALMFQCLMLADKSDAASEMRAILTRGGHIVCDRWIPSSYCYGSSDGLEPAWLDRMHSSLPQADLNLFLDIPPEEAVRRRPEAGDRYEQDREKQKVVRTNYEALWKRGSYPTWQVVNGEGAIEEVAERIWRAVVNVYGRELR